MYSIWIWRMPYKELYVVLRDVVGPGGKITSNPTGVIGSDYLDILQEELRRRGLHSLGRQPDDHPSLIETWI